MKRSYILCFISCFALLFISAESQAMPRYGEWWLEKYENISASGNASCQLCHKNFGGNGWNEYGWDVRSVFNALTGNEESRLLEALDQIENFSTNNSSNTFIQEIEENAQPGWDEGQVNLIRYSNGTADEVIAPPTNLPCGVLIDTSSSLVCEIENPNEPILQGNIVINLETIATGFSDPVLALSSPDPVDLNFIFVVEKGGKIWRVNINNGTKRLFLDFSAELVGLTGSLGERGLLGVAFDPDYVTNNQLYTYLSKPANNTPDFTTLANGEVANHQSVISKWLIVNPQSSSPAATAENEMLIIDQPQSNHNAGTITFAPDGYLYIALGDGGSGNDQGIGHGENGNGRDNTNPLGTILRIDPAGNNSANGKYGIPSTNPFVGLAGLDEIYAYGFRNPYRFSFEDLGNQEFNLYVGDVGQGAIEEVNRIHSSEAGGNYGWNYKEGSYFFYTGATGTFVSEEPPAEVLPPLIDPIAEYDHDVGISVIGGHVYTGSELSGAENRYVFAEYGRTEGRLMYLDANDRIREFKYESATNMRITGFGVDQHNELYVVGNASSNGVLKKITLGVEQEICLPITTSNGKIAVICI